jgi:N-acetylmuramoyl-L-alanine amidase
VLGGVRNYFESMPPPGTWFAAQAARRNGTYVASTPAPVESADSGDDSSDAKPSPKSVAKAPPAPAKASKVVAKADTPAKKGASGRADDNIRDLHRVGRGETLTGIAQQYGVSVGALKLANKMNDNTVRVGSVMVIPSG